MDTLVRYVILLIYYDYYIICSSALYSIYDSQNKMLRATFPESSRRKLNLSHVLFLSKFKQDE